MNKQAEDRKHADASITVQSEEQELEINAVKEVIILLSKFCLRLNALATVNIISSLQDMSGEATG